MPRHTRHRVGTVLLRFSCETPWVQFSPAIDPRLAASVSRIPDLSCSAEVWRALRRRARRFDTTTPCYESVRRLVNAERERRALIVAALATAIEVVVRRIPILPEDVPRIYARRLAWARARQRHRALAPP